MFLEYEYSFQMIGLEVGCTFEGSFVDHPDVIKAIGGFVTDLVNDCYGIRSYHDVKHMKFNIKFYGFQYIFIF